MRPKIAIVCDWLVSRGGAERVIFALSEMFPDAPIFTPIYNEKKLPEFKDKKIVTSFLQNMPWSKTKHHLYLPFMPYAVEQFDLSAYDIVISSSHSCAKGVITKPRTLHICYCHSPMRYAWDNCHQYLEQYGILSILKGTAKRMIHRLRIWDRVSADRPDFYIANSDHVKKRIYKYYRKESEVIFPPVETEKFGTAAHGKNSPKSETKKLSAHNGKFFLAVGRLAPYKRFDLLIETFNDLKLPLVIVGVGKEERALKAKAGRFITFVGAVSDAELSHLYQNAIAFIFPQSEDFGITPVEAMSAGVPVIAYADGGALETVVPGKTGLYFTSQNVESLKKAVLESQTSTWNRSAIQAHAQSFSKAIFRQKIKSFIDQKWEIWQKDMR